MYLVQAIQEGTLLTKNPPVSMIVSIKTVAPDWALFKFKNHAPRKSPREAAVKQTRRTITILIRYAPIVPFNPTIT